MLVARQYETDQGRWSSKFDPLLNRSKNLRMSNYDGSSSLQPGWNGHASVVNTRDNSLYPHSAGRTDRESIDDITTSRLQTKNTSGSLPEITVEQPASLIGTNSPGYQSSGTLDLSQPQAGLPDHARSTRNVHGLVVKPEASSDFAVNNHHNVTSNTLSRPSGPSQVAHSSSPTTQFDREASLHTKDEDDLGDEDDDMLDVEGEISGRPMTAAERTAARRKMKRFRLANQTDSFYARLELTNIL